MDRHVNRNLGPRRSICCAAASVSETNLSPLARTDCVIERFFQALKYEYLYRNEIGDGATLAASVDCHQTVYNDVRPHEAIAFRTPLSAWRDFDCPTSSNLFTPKTVSLS